MDITKQQQFSIRIFICESHGGHVHITYYHLGGRGTAPGYYKGVRAHGHTMVVTCIISHERNQVQVSMRVVTCISHGCVIFVKCISHGKNHNEESATSFCVKVVTYIHK